MCIAVNANWFPEIAAMVDHLSHDDAVRAVVWTGAGRAFCSGADQGKGTTKVDVS